MAPGWWTHWSWLAGAVALPGRAVSSDGGGAGAAACVSVASPGGSWRAKAAAWPCGQPRQRRRVKVGAQAWCCGARWRARHGGGLPVAEAPFGGGWELRARSGPIWSGAGLLFLTLFKVRVRPDLLAPAPWWCRWPAKLRWVGSSPFGPRPGGGEMVRSLILLLRRGSRFSTAMRPKGGSLLCDGRRG